MGLALFCIGTGSGQEAHAVPYPGEVIAYTGRAVPGVPEVEFTGFLTPSISNTGEVSFKATYTGHQFGLWSTSGGVLEKTVLRGESPPDEDEDITFQLISDPVVYNGDEVAFVASVIGPDISSSNDSGLWIARDDSLDLLVRDGDHAPGTGEGVYFKSLFFSPNYYKLATNVNGQTAFRGRLGGPGVDATNYMGIWSGGVGSLWVVARAGNHAPGTEQEVVFDGFTDNPIINQSGQVAFSASLTAPEELEIIDDTNSAGIWAERSGSLDLIARTGNPAPGTSAVFADYFSSVRFNHYEQVVFNARLSGEGVDETNDEGIWSSSTVADVLLVREGDQAPGADPGQVFAPANPWELALYEPVLNERGRIAFFAGLSGPGTDETNNSGLWSNRSGTLELIVRAGDPAPGADPGFYFNQFYREPIMNRSGQIVFENNLIGPDGATLESIWVSQPNGELSLVALEGHWGIDILFMHQGAGAENGWKSAINDLGQLTYNAEINDGNEAIFRFELGLTGDLNHDGFVGMEDLEIILNNWLTHTDPGDSSAGDASGDGYIFLEDLDLVLNNWNVGTPPATDITTIPEPVSAVLMLMCGVTLLRRR